VPDYKRLSYLGNKPNLGNCYFCRCGRPEAHREGIYDWDIPGYVAETYFTGFLDNPLPLKDDGSYNLNFLNLIPRPIPDTYHAGNAGRIPVQLQSPADRLLSGLDGKLHLRYAATSYWTWEMTTAL